MRGSNIRAVAFDLDNTLWDVEPVIARAEAELMEWMRRHCPRIPERHSVESLRLARAQLATEEPHQAHDLGYLRRTVLARVALECGYPESLADEAYEVFHAARCRLELYADVQPALVRMRSRYALATLTNGSADLTRIGISEYFVASLTPREVGAAKPHALAFERLVEALGLKPEQVLYVGDDPHCDVHGARSAGLRTAWMNRRDLEWPADMPRADIIVRDCAELVQCLDV